MLETLRQHRIRRANAIACHQTIDAAIASGQVNQRESVTLSEAIILGLLKQGVKNYVGILGHGSTDVAEVIRIYEEAGLVKMFAVRHETEAVHAATALRWVTGEKSAVITSIGPGALHALAGSLAPKSDGLGVWFLLGDETTHDEGPNMQQIPGYEQNQFHRLFSAMGKTYTLHTPEAIGTALRRGFSATDHPFRQEPFFLLMPMNIQPHIIEQFNLIELPDPSLEKPRMLGSQHAFAKAVESIRKSQRIVVKVGGGARGLGPELLDFLEEIDGVAVHSPLVPGVIPFSHPRNMMVGGSKGTICGNFAMSEADLLIALGTRAVCQSDCSRTGYPEVKTVININTDPDTVMHYSRNISLLGDVPDTVQELLVHLKHQNIFRKEGPSEWFTRCRAKREEWDLFRNERYATATIFDEMWQREVLTQPVVIKTATDWAIDNDFKTFFDAGDVQANGFQIVEAEKPGLIFTETGASYMGFAASALLATAMSEKPFYAVAICGDGSFMMNPQILIDGVAHGANGCILLLDNRRMGAISGLQQDQYQKTFATWDRVEVDYIAMANSIKGVATFDAGYSVEGLRQALEKAKNTKGLSLVYARVYFGENPLGGMGVFGRWNVGNWCDETQALRHWIGI